MFSFIDLWLYDGKFDDQSLSIPNSKIIEEINCGTKNGLTKDILLISNDPLLLYQMANFLFHGQVNKICWYKFATNCYQFSGFSRHYIPASYSLYLHLLLPTKNLHVKNKRIEISNQTWTPERCVDCFVERKCPTARVHFVRWGCIVIPIPPLFVTLSCIMPYLTMCFYGDSYNRNHVICHSLTPPRYQVYIFMVYNEWKYTLLCSEDIVQFVSGLRWVVWVNHAYVYGGLASLFVH